MISIGHPELVALKYYHSKHLIYNPSDINSLSRLYLKGSKIICDVTLANYLDYTALGEVLSFLLVRAVAH